MKVYGINNNFNNCSDARKNTNFKSSTCKTAAKELSKLPKWLNAECLVGYSGPRSRMSVPEIVNPKLTEEQNKAISQMLNAFGIDWRCHVHEYTTSGRMISHV